MGGNGRGSKEKARGKTKEETATVGAANLPRKGMTMLTPPPEIDPDLCFVRPPAAPRIRKGRQEKSEGKRTSRDARRAAGKRKSHDVRDIKVERGIV